MQREDKSLIAYQKIKEEIISENIKQNVYLSENVLARKLNMSRTPIRNALQKLQIEGFIKIIPHQGIILQEVSITEVREIYDLRIAVEVFVIKKAINSLNQNDFDNLRQILNLQNEAMIEKNKMKFMQLDNDFHLYFHKGYYNQKIHSIICSFRERFLSLGLKALEKTNRMETSFREHNEILTALENKNIEKAVAELENHLEEGYMSHF